jgi:hypothetical protein
VARPAPLLLLLAVASCDSPATPACPGEAVARFAFDGEEATSTTPLAAGLDPEPALTDCPPELEFPAAVRLVGTLSADPAGSAGALCRSTGAIMYGTRTGPRWEVETASDGAVLARCGLTCVARSRTVVAGDVLPDPGAPTSFQGALVEQLSVPRTDVDCHLCALPCAKRYVLTGAAETPP